MGFSTYRFKIALEIDGANAHECRCGGDDIRIGKQLAYAMNSMKSRVREFNQVPETMIREFVEALDPDLKKRLPIILGTSQ
jgi:hypothetical protein